MVRSNKQNANLIKMIPQNIWKFWEVSPFFKARKQQLKKIILHKNEDGSKAKFYFSFAQQFHFQFVVQLSNYRWEGGVFALCSISSVARKRSSWITNCVMQWQIHAINKVNGNETCYCRTC